jgi:SH3-like domain-containing protein
MNPSLRITVFRILLLLLMSSVTMAQTPGFRNLLLEIQAIQKQLVPDKRVAILDVSLLDTLKSVVILKGKTDLPEAKKRIIDLLLSKGIRYTDSLKMLPEKSLGDKIWGLATLSVSSLRSGPDHANEMLTQAVMGTPLRVLEYSDGWYRVQTPDLYIGWMEGNGLAHFTLDELNQWKKSNRYLYNCISGNAFEAPSRKSMVVTDLVLGDLFEVTAETKGFLKMKTPDGRTGFVKKSECRSWSDWTNREPNVQTMISIARKMLGTPYLWGGTSSKAMDCSGFTKTSYYSQGVILARDASQQTRYGEHPDFKSISSLQSGDLLFFGRSAQRVTHVGLYLGNGRFIHASGLVRINSLDPNDPLFSETLLKKLVNAARIVNSLNTEGITRVKDHPWFVIKN